MVKYLMWLDPYKFAQWLSDRLWNEFEPRFRQIEKRMSKMATVEDVHNAITAQFEAVSPAISDVQAKLRDLTEMIASGATSDQLQGLVDDVNSSTSQIASAVADAMNDDNTPDPTVPVPDPENPLPTPDGPNAPSTGDLDENGNPV